MSFSIKLRKKYFSQKQIFQFSAKKEKLKNVRTFDLDACGVIFSNIENEFSKKSSNSSLGYLYSLCTNSPGKRIHVTVP